MSKQHIPYEQRLGHPEDFKVKYRFYSKDEGGRESLPFQGIRSDFWYEHTDHKMKGIFMIWPEFEDAVGNLIDLEEVEREGIARMWIVNNELRPYHQERIKVGAKGYFMEGSKTGECEVIKIVGLLRNPITINKVQ